ncbi:MAG: hypothetical protein H6626_02335 [Pseudobdellovibrionaceae bacterium]|nr:hypothetical protein [Bdellovibrionales bacterium]USN47950.1 MAG: hypothetical protein H6626_02335 [Pseudobdellovibrionaceae bacterium]
MSKIRALGVSSLVLLLVSCNTISAPLVVEKAFSLRDSFGNLVKVDRGEWEATATMTRDDRFRLDIDLDSNDPFPPGEDNPDESYSFEFRVPAGNELPSENGSFYLPSAESGQPVDVSGELQTTRWRSDLRRGYEWCDYSCQEYICYGNNDCGWRWTTCRGQRYVEYYTNYMKREFQFKVLPPGKSEVTNARFEGSQTGAHNDYIHQGMCR